METSSVVVSARGRRRSLSEARELVAAWQASGEGVARWCRRHGHGHARSALKLWRKRIAVADSASPVSGFIALRRPCQAKGLAPEAPGASVVVELGDGIRVLGLDGAGVAALIRAMRADPQ